MNITCGHCRQSLREDDSLRTLQIDNVGIVAICSECVAAARGLEPGRTVYPVGCHLPEINEGMRRRPIRVCGTCRQAMRGDWEYHLVRLAFGDCALEEGQYACCPPCRELYGQLVLDRLIAEGLQPIYARLNTISRHALT